MSEIDTRVDVQQNNRRRRPRYATQFAVKKHPAPSSEEALLMTLIKPEEAARYNEQAPVVERAFEGDRDLKEHCERLFAVHKDKIGGLLKELQRRSETLDEETTDMLSSCRRFVEKFGYSPDELMTEPPVEQPTASEAQVFPEQLLQFGKAWEKITFSHVVTDNSNGDPTREVVMELDYTLDCWRDRTRDGVADPEDFESITMQKDTANFLKMYYLYITNGVSDNPGTIFNYLEGEQKKKIEAYLRFIKKLPQGYDLDERLTHNRIVITREELENVDEANEELGVHDLEEKARIDYYHGWSADRRVGLYLARRYKNFAFVASDAMGIHGNRSEKFSNMADRDHKFSLRNYAEQIKYRFEMGDMNGVLWGWSMGGEAVRLALILMLKDIETQIGEQLTTEKIDQFNLKQKYASLFTISETPAGEGTCDFLIVKPDGTIEDKAFSAYSGLLINTGHKLAQLGMADWPIVSNVAGGLTDMHGSTLFPNENVGHQIMLGIHVENLKTQADNRIIREQSKAITQYDGLSDDEMRLAALAEYMFPRIQAIGIDDKLTDAGVQQKLFAEEAKVSAEVGVRAPISLRYKAGHPLATSPGFREFPVDTLAYVSPLHYEKIHELIIIQKKLQYKLPLTDQENSFYEEVKAAASVSRLLTSNADKKGRPLQALVHEKMMSKLEMISGFVVLYGNNAEDQQALYTLFSYLEEQDMIIPEVEEAKNAKYTPLPS